MFNFRYADLSECCMRKILCESGDLMNVVDSNTRVITTESQKIFTFKYENERIRK